MHVPSRSVRYYSTVDCCRVIQFMNLLGKECFPSQPCPISFSRQSSKLLFLVGRKGKNIKYYSKSRKKYNLFEATEQAKYKSKQNWLSQQHKLKVKKLWQVRIEQRWITLHSTLISHSCGILFSPVDPANIYPDHCIVYIVRIVVNSLICRPIVLLNIPNQVSLEAKEKYLKILNRAVHTTTFILLAFFFVLFQ